MCRPQVTQPPQPPRRRVTRPRCLRPPPRIHPRTRRHRRASLRRHPTARRPRTRPRRMRIHRRLRYGGHRRDRRLTDLDRRVAHSVGRGGRFRRRRRLAHHERRLHPRRHAVCPGDTPSPASEGPSAAAPAAARSGRHHGPPRARVSAQPRR
jgi:hypothetical protein